MQPCARPTDLFVVSCPDPTFASSSHMTNGILLTWHNQEIAQWSPDPFPHERVGSGPETNADLDYKIIDFRFRQRFRDFSQDFQRFQPEAYKISRSEQLLGFGLHFCELCHVKMGTT